MPTFVASRSEGDRASEVTGHSDITASTKTYLDCKARPGKEGRRPSLEHCQLGAGGAVDGCVLGETA